MKRNVQLTYSPFNEQSYIEYDDGNISLSYWSDASGHLTVKDVGFDDSSGTHKSRVNELRQQRDKINKALKVLEQIEDPKLYLNGTYKAVKG
jgi:hypothetical protein